MIVRLKIFIRMLGVMRLALTKHDAAMKDYLYRHYHVVTQDRFLTGCLVELCFKSRSFSEIVEAVDAYHPNSDEFETLNLELLTYRAESLLQLHRYEEAMAAWLQLRRIYEDAPALFVPLDVEFGDARTLMAMGKYEEALPHLIRSNQLAPDDTDVKRYLDKCKYYLEC